ncbi:MAG: hypothetical protein HYY96_01600 [Candidatus Tectomicrobia bacterium]|nr:hypothetical protein [Candidatus Tectomicrobia bacterium]
MAKRLGIAALVVGLVAGPPVWLGRSAAPMRLGEPSITAVDQSGYRIQVPLTLPEELGDASLEVRVVQPEPRGLSFTPSQISFTIKEIKDVELEVRAPGVLVNRVFPVKQMQGLALRFTADRLAGEYQRSVASGAPLAERAASLHLAREAYQELSPYDPAYAAAKLAALGPAEAGEPRSGEATAGNGMTASGSGTAAMAQAGETAGSGAAPVAASQDPRSPSQSGRASGAASADDFGPVAGGETLFNVGRRLGIPEADLSKAAVALWRMNREKFVDGNIHRLRAGERLAVGQVRERMAGISHREARKIIEQQATTLTAPDEQQGAPGRDARSRAGGAGNGAPALLALVREAAAPGQVEMASAAQPSPGAPQEGTSSASREAPAAAAAPTAATAVLQGEQGERILQHLASLSETSNSIAKEVQAVRQAVLRQQADSQRAGGRRSTSFLGSLGGGDGQAPAWVAWAILALENLLLVILALMLLRRRRPPAVA